MSVTAQPEGLLIRWENGPEAAGSAANDTLVVMALPGDTGNGIYEFHISSPLRRCVSVEASAACAGGYPGRCMGGLPQLKTDLHERQHLDKKVIQPE